MKFEFEYSWKGPTPFCKEESYIFCTIFPLPHAAVYKEKVTGYWRVELNGDLDEHIFDEKETASDYAMVMVRRQIEKQHKKLSQ